MRKRQAVALETVKDYTHVNYYRHHHHPYLRGWHGLHHSWPDPIASVTQRPLGLISHLPCIPRHWTVSSGQRSDVKSDWYMNGNYTAHFLAEKSKLRPKVHRAPCSPPPTTPSSLPALAWPLQTRAVPDGAGLSTDSSPIPLCLLPPLRMVVKHLIVYLVNDSKETKV